MVFYFTICDPSYVVYMGKDKYENEELIKHAWPEDVWFHVDKFSSAHVYLRLRDGDFDINTIPSDVLEDLAQLTKQNSIEGSKRNNVQIVYTMASNLKKTGGMEVGQVSFHNQKEVKYTKVETRKSEIINRLSKTKEERHPDLLAEKMSHMKELNRRERNAAAERARAEKEEQERRKKEAEARNYDLLEDHELMTSNKGLGNDYEEDFM
ncbi:Coiled-coil domain-containing protein 25-like [Porphyridium purpureum]|uniref:Coiled-coil domain-containing protein 25-like n=1 Tax=Porphyridium purpureum TaxID=35688 RepID=A0A5J4YTT1_PORPP|nr:Coiled-coil domain-containing protein 25-like [Porphyridium purpureum]|eukprot:POR6529..scf227_4